MEPLVFIYFYLIGNLLSVYAVSKFFCIFFEDKITSNITVFIVYGSYFMATSAVYLGFNMPLLTMTTNIVFMLLITCLYQSTIFKKISAVGLVYAVSLLVESCVVLIAVNFKWKFMELSSLIVSRIVLLIIVQLLHINNYLKKDVLISKIQRISIVLFPLGSIILFQILVNAHMKFISLLICLLILLVFDFLIFYIFDRLNKEYIKTLHKKMKIQQMEMEMQMYLREKNIYENQIKIMNDTHEKLNILQHDIKGHYFSLKSLVENNEIEEVKRYLERMYQTMHNDEMYIDTGNVTITSILNYYIKQVKKMNIKIEYDVKIPEELNIELYDLSTILINLLQNALEALEKCHNDKYMKIKLVYDRNIFYIMIKNTYDGNIKNENGKLLTTKEDKLMHGLGVKSVDKSIKRYNGEIEYEYTDNMFKIFVMLYDDKIWSKQN